MKIHKIVQKVAIGYPKTILLLFSLLTLGAVFSIPNLTKDTTPWLLPIEHPSRVAYEEFKASYTSSRDGIFILLAAKDDIFNPESLERVQLLTSAFEEVQLISAQDLEFLKDLADRLPPTEAETLKNLASGDITDMDSWEALITFKEMLSQTEYWDTKTAKFFDKLSLKYSPIIDVTSLSNTDNILSSDEGLDINSIFEDIPETPQELATIKEQVISNHLFDRILVINGGKSTAIIIESAIPDSETAIRYQLLQRVRNILEKEIPGPEKHYLAGMPVFSSTISKTMEADSARLFPIVFIIVIVSLLVTFRGIKGIIIPMLVVILTLLCALGLQALMGIPTNIVSTALPVFILSIGVADGIHIFSEYRDHILNGLGKVEAVIQTIKELTSPVVMTSITTAAAFLALSFTEIIQIKHFGWFVAIGTIIAMFFSLFFIPALLLVLPEKKGKKSIKPSNIDLVIDRLLISVSLKALKKPITIISVFATLAVIAIVGATKVKVENNIIDYFNNESELVVSTNKINSEAAGSTSLNIIIEPSGSEPEPLKNPENLKPIVNLAAYLEKHELVGKVLGLTTLLERINLVIHQNNPAYDSLPSAEPGSNFNGKDVIAQYLLLYENGGGDVLSDYVYSDYTQMNLQAMIRTNSSAELSRLKSDIDQWAIKNFPSNLKYRFSGSASVMTDTTNEIVNGQTNSFSISLVLTLLLLIITFRSLKTGIIGIIPLMSTVLMNFGIMGFLGVPLDIGSAIISSIVIGVGVDYAIHYINRFQVNIQNGLSFTESISNTVKFSGKAIAANAITVAAGFIALLFSELSPLFTMGWMIILTMLVSAISTIILLPVLIHIFENKKIKVTNQQSSKLAPA